MIDFQRLSRERHKILLVNDDQDAHRLSRMALRSLTYGGRGIEILNARSGEHAVEVLHTTPNVAVILLDATAEADGCSLETCERIRNEMGNSLVRILLRTDQPITDFSRSVFQSFDIDGHLCRKNFTSARLYSAMRTSLKNFAENARQERHRSAFQQIDDRMLSLRSYESPETMMERVVNTGIEVLWASELAIHLRLSITDHKKEYTLTHVRSGEPADIMRRETELRQRISSWTDPRTATHGSRAYAPEIFENGLLVRFTLAHGLGEGWIFMAVEDRDLFTRHCLGLIARHATNSFYGAAAQRQIHFERPRSTQAVQLSA